MLPSPLFFLSHSLSFLIHALFSLVFFPRISPLPEFSNPTNFAAPSNPTIASRFFHVTVIADCYRFQVKHVFFFFQIFYSPLYVSRSNIFIPVALYRHLRVETVESEKTIDRYIKTKRFRLFRFEWKNEDT